jgi:hypothetical protein
MSLLNSKGKIPQQNVLQNKMSLNLIAAK